MITYVLDVAKVDGVHQPLFVVLDVCDGENVEVLHEQAAGAWRHFNASVIHQVGVVCGLEAYVLLQSPFIARVCARVFLCVCMYAIYVCIMHVCVCVYMCVYLCMHICTYVSMYDVGVCVYTYMCMYVCQCRDSSVCTH